MAGRRVLVPEVRVRVLPPQPQKRTGGADSAPPVPHTAALLRSRLLLLNLNVPVLDVPAGLVCPRGDRERVGPPVRLAVVLNGDRVGALDAVHGGGAVPG